MHHATAVGVSICTFLDVVNLHVCMFHRETSVHTIRYMFVKQMCAYNAGWNASCVQPEQRRGSVRLAMVVLHHMARGSSKQTQLASVLCSAESFAMSCSSINASLELYCSGREHTLSGIRGCTRCGIEYVMAVHRLTRRARGATSKRSLSFALVEGDVTLEKTPFSFTMICRKGTAR